MLKKIFTILVFLSSLSLAEMYTDLKYNQLNYSNNGTDKKFKADGYKLTLGYMFEELTYLKEFKYFDIGIENSIAFAQGTKRASVGYKNETILKNASVDIDFLYAVNMKATAPLVDILYGNVYLGWNTAKIGTKASNYDNSSQWENSFSYGLGVEYWIPLGVSMQLTYMSYFNNLNGIEFGFGLKF